MCAEPDAVQGTPAYAQACERHRALAAQSPQSADLHYVAARCGSDDEAQNQAFYDGHARWPDSGWFALAAGYSHAERALGAVTARSRGLAYSTAAIVLGERCPQAWREGAKRLLFTVERPYFS